MILYFHISNLLLKHSIVLISQLYSFKISKRMTQTSTDTMLEFKWFGLGALVYTSAYFAYQFSINRKKQSKVTQQYKTPQSSVLSNSVYSTYYFDKNKEFLDI